MARPGTHRMQLDRGLAAMTVGLQQDRVHRQRMLADGYTGEFEQQFQINLSGSAGNNWAYVDQEFSFEYPFLYAPIQRRVPFQTPHFRCGFELQGAATPPNPWMPVLLHAQVIGWNYSEENWIVGVKVRFMVQAPSAVSTGVPYTAVAHLTFQGYCSLPEGGEFA